jgi:formylglycine-generating enzyme required for sulfatase activity
VPLAYGPPNAPLGAELDRVAEAAGAVVRALDEANTLAPSFPEAALRDLCAALEGLPEGTAEGCRVDLDVARNWLPMLRRAHFVDADADEASHEDAEPPLYRDGALDQRLGALIVAVSTALDEYRHQAQEAFEDATRVEETLAVDRPTTERLRADADAVVDGLEGAIGELDAKGVSASARGDVLRRRLKDGENLTLAAKAQLGAKPVVRRWLAWIGAALKRTPDGIRAAAKAIRVGVDVAEPFKEWWLQMEWDTLDALLKSFRGLSDALDQAADRLPTPRVADKALDRPPWAVDGGTDEFGDWAEFDYEGVRQRLRWIPPGTFMMGSPEDEVGRFESEGPQHEVTIGAGFWLFATPVTQALYEAVRGENPSRIKGAERPVENVCWHDARAFLDAVNERVPELDLVLPSEAQWEHACRAGTTTATYAGDLPDLDAAGARLLDGIAWFNQNSRRETQPVGQKRRNPWGLSDMLGNVFEWCADHWHSNYEGSPADGSARLDDAADGTALRVLRGGSWLVGARYCRAANRRRDAPDLRCDSLGFRPARGQG